MTTTTTRSNFLGIPIDGDITRSKRTPQRPREEFEPLVKALLNEPFIREFGWRQCTPYFNDGDPCVFGAGSLWVRTVPKVPVELGEMAAAQLAALDESRVLNALTEREYRAARARVLDEEPDDDDDDDDEDDTSRLEVGWGIHPTLGGMEGYGEHEHYAGDREDIWRVCNALHEAIESEAFDNVLLDLFGDHATVTVRRTGITVDTYEHD